MFNLMNSIISTSGITVSSFLICSAASVLLGIAIAFIHTLKNTYSKSFLVTLITIPVIVEAVIMLVNGNLGAGVAVAGTFSLVRFRSAPGTAREICSLFLAMAVGLATGMGYIFVAVMLVLVVGLLSVILAQSKFMETVSRTLQISIPENLDYEGVFEPVFADYADRFELVNVRTAQMGTVYKLMYDVTLKNGISTKSFIDAIRVRNGNLEVSLGRSFDKKEDQQL